MSRPRYTVHAHDWDGRFWTISAALAGRESEPITQATKIRDIEAMAREAIAIRLDTAEDAFDIDMRLDAPQHIADLMAALEESVAEAKAARVNEAAARRAAAVAAREAGFTVRDAGEILGVTHQRVAQLLKEHDAA